MADYISREAAICEILSEPTDAHYPSWYAGKLKDIPTANVRSAGEISDAVDETLDFLNRVSNLMPYPVYSALFDLIDGIFPE